MTYYGKVNIEPSLLREDYMSIRELYGKYDPNDLDDFGLECLGGDVGGDWAAISEYKYPIYIESVETKVKYIGNHTWKIKDYVHVFNFLKR